jgi:lycopene cyclase domain-containing protein
MATYLILNCVFITIVVLLLRLKPRIPSKRWWITFSIVVAMTAIFDNVIITLGIVSYDQTKLLNVYIGKVPIEDFFYTLLACIIVPGLWNSLSIKVKK